MVGRSRRDMLYWAAGGLACMAAWGRVAAQLSPAQERLFECYPDSGGSYTMPHLACLEAELQQHIPITFETVPGVNAIDSLAAKKAEGGVAFIIGDTEDTFRLFEALSVSSASADKLLAMASKMSGQDWLRTEYLQGVRYSLEQLPPDYEVTIRGVTVQVKEMSAVDWDNLEEVPLSEVAVGEWPDHVEPNNLVTAVRERFVGGFKPQVVIATLDTNDWTAVPAFLRYGGWNACPHPQVHAAVWRYWQQEYGVELVSARFDTLEFRVARPPGDRQQALDLAREQYAYCNDIVDQGVGSLANLAALLMESRYWYFWWD